VIEVWHGRDAVRLPQAIPFPLQRIAFGLTRLNVSKETGELLLLPCQTGDVCLDSGRLPGESLSFVGLNVADAVRGDDRRRQVVSAATPLARLGQLSGEPDLTQARPVHVTRAAMAGDVVAGGVRGRGRRRCRCLEILDLISGILLKPFLCGQPFKRIAQPSPRACDRSRVRDRCDRRIELYAVSEQSALGCSPRLACFLVIVGQSFVAVGQLVQRGGVVGTNTGRRYRLFQVGVGINPDFNEPAP